MGVRDYRKGPITIRTPDWNTADWAIMKSDAWNMKFTTATSGSTAYVIVPDGAEYFDECRYGGTCTYCGVRIEPGDSIWWFRDEQALRSRIWCGHHKTRDTPVGVDPLFTRKRKTKTTRATAREANNKEQDMAQRQDFTFPYTGEEIAASLERKAAKLDAQIVTEVSLDRATVALLGYTSDKAYEELVASKQKDVERKNKLLADQAAELRKEGIPYAKAGKQEFRIDLEDIEFFGLNDEDAPAAAPKRRRRSPERVGGKELANA